ncbi:unnamed protein product [Lepeophtheirus salmonis]|uniref:(salmon louse) hypothetical protein n=1 Tax=Lepeophtheirus salmonis TaxID=72036 RepID=A0A7R8CI36_LEPSM|nr:unnamed protein product [Lepeophtheirus salmonis]CAF2828906.1 unnamed protein product [Lepeophtheirus salmonis]
MHLATVSLLLFIGTTLSQGIETPSIGFITPDIIGDIGQNIKLECVIQNGEDYPVNWMKLNDRSSDDLISTGSTLVIKDPRFHLKSEDGTYILTIEELKESDASKYQCQVVVSLNDKKTADVSVKVKLPPVVSDDTPVNVQSVEGEERMDGALMFNGNNEVIGNILTIKKVQRGDRGTYICSASNGVGDDVEHAIYFEIGFTPEIYIDRPRTSQALGYDVELTCKISAFPTPGITWYRLSNNSTDNIRIDEGNNYQLSHFAQDNGLFVTQLKIIGITEEQFGSYICKAVNKFGSAVQTIELYTSTLPICPPICKNYELMFLSSSKGPLRNLSSQKSQFLGTWDQLTESLFIRSEESKLSI